MEYDLSAYQGLGSFDLTIQTSCKYYYGAYNGGDWSAIDNFNLYYELPPGSVEGYVLNGDGLTIAAASVGIPDLGLSTTSGPDGYYFLDPVQVGTWDIQGWKEGYNLVTSSVTVYTGATTYHEIILTQPTMIINPLQLNETLNPNEWLKDWLGILNNGDGPLDWTAVINFPPGDAASGYQQDITKVKVRDFSNVSDNGDLSTIPGGNGQAMDTRGAGLDCPEGSVFDYHAVSANNGYTSDGSYQCYQSFAGATGSFTTVTAFAIHTSAPSGPRGLLVEVYEAGSSPGALVSSTIATVDPVNTGVPVIGYDTYSYTIEIPVCDLTDGWVSVYATAGGSPTWYWLNTFATPSYPAFQNTVSLPEGLALCLSGSSTSGWLTLDAYEGTVAAMGGSYSLGVNFDASGFEAGDYVTADIVVSSDPDVGTITIPCSMTVMGDPLNPPTDLEVELVNNITGQVYIEWLWTADAFQYFTVYRDGGFVGTSTVMHYTDFLPDFGEYCYTVVAVYDEGQTSPAGPECVEWPNPVMVINPMSLYAEVWMNHTAMVSTNISNTGVGTLSYAFPDFVPGDDSRAYCTATSTYCDEYISNVTIGTINNSSGCTYYADYTNLSTDVAVGDPYPITITIGSPWSSDQGGIWVDWNQNEDFYDDEPITVSGSPGYGPYTATIIPPEDAEAGPTRMRIRLCYATAPLPCGTQTFGEVEDYTLNVTGGSFITIVNPNQGYVDPGSNVDIAITYDATDFDPGLYSEWLYIESNDPNRLWDSIYNEMLVYVPGQFVGTVTDGNTGIPISGVVVTAEQWQTTTAPDGTYSLYVDQESYDVYFEKIAYQNVVVYDTFALAGVFTPIDVEMFEEAYPPGFVLATVNEDDTECLVEWGLPAGPYEIIYDDGSADDFFVWSTAGNANAVKFTPAGYPATVIGGKIYVGDGSFPAGGNFLGTTFGAVVYDDDGEDGLPGTQLDSVEVEVNNYGWVDISNLSATIYDGDFFIAMFQGGLPPNTAPLGIDYSIPTVYRSYSYDAVVDVWALSAYQDFMIRAIVSGPQSDDGMAESTEIVYPTKPVKQNFITIHAPKGIPGTVKSGEYRPVTDGPATNRNVVSYSIARLSNFDPNGSPLAGDTTVLSTGLTALSYNDVAFGGLPMGWYAYCVRAQYTNGDLSDCAVSNIVGHIMNVDVTVNVTLSTGDSPEGAEVKLTALNYPHIDRFAIIDITGTVTFEDMWKGCYDISASMIGFDPYDLPNYCFYADEILDIMLLEKKYPPYNLYVDPLSSIATWNEPRIIALNEDFNGSLFPPEDWTSETEGQGWFATTNGSSSYWTIPSHDSQYACSNDDHSSTNVGCCDYLITPPLDLRESEGYSLKFDSYYDGYYGQSAYVEYSLDAGATWEVLYTLSPATTWVDLEVDLSAYSGLTGPSAIWLTFHSDDNGGWGSGWAIDNVDVSVGSADGPPMGYHVFLDGAFVKLVEETTYTYQNLVYGVEYEASVGALYSSGLSAKAYYTFISEYLYPPRNLTDEYEYGLNEVPLFWNPPMTGSSDAYFSNVENGTVSGTTAHSIKAAPNTEYSGSSTPGTIEFTCFRDDHTGYFMNTSSDVLYSMNMTDYSYTQIGSTVVDASSGDFMNGATEMWYTTANWGADLYSVDITTGIGTYIAPTSGVGMDVTGMACDRATNTMYVCFTDISVSGIGTIDLGTGVITQIGANQTVAPGLIDIAIDGTGQMYAWGIVNDASYTIDKATGDVTMLGSLGINLNYGQGGNWDQTDDVIYMTAYNASAGTEFRALDIVTGGTIYLGPLPTSQNTAFGVPGTGGSGGNVPDGLLSFNMYRDGEYVANILYDGEDVDDTLMYVDNNVMPGCYDYEITALYDLTDYGFPGEIGESTTEGPDEICVGWGIPLPFFEGWDQGSFDLQDWTKDAENWQINSQVGNPEPSAEFSWDPLLEDDYSASLTTSPLKADMLIDGDIFVDFDLKLDDRNSTGEEVLRVEVKEADGNWVAVVAFANDGSYEFRDNHVKITDVAMGNIFQVRFNAMGQNSFDIVAWYVDNIHIYRLCAPPVDLKAVHRYISVDEGEITLSWTPPGGGSGGGGEWISYNDGTFENAISSTAGGAGLAQVFTPPQYPCTVTKVRFFVDDYLNYYQDEEVYVLTGDGATILAGPYVVPGVEADWVTVDVDPVSITEGTFMVATFNVLPDGPFIGIDDSYYDATLYFGAIGSFTELGEYGYFCVGSHEAYVEYVSDNVVVNSVLTSPQSNGLRADISESNTFSNGTIKPNRDLLGYNVFRSDEGGIFEQINDETVLDTTYVDTTGVWGELCYYVTTVYDQCESDASNDTCIYNWVGIEELTFEDAITVYPNPASDFVNIVSTEAITRITVINYVGQIVYEKKVSDETNILLNTASYETGVYMIKIETDDVITVKRVTITR